MILWQLRGSAQPNPQGLMAARRPMLQALGNIRLPLCEPFCCHMQFCKLCQIRCNLLTLLIRQHFTRLVSRRVAAGTGGKLSEQKDPVILASQLQSTNHVQSLTERLSF